MTEIEAFAAYVQHPDTNRAAFGLLFGETMDPPEYRAITKVISVIMSEIPSCPETTGSPSRSPSPAQS